MIFRLHRKHIPGDASLKFDGKVLKSVLAKKFLGVIHDYKFSWCEHLIELIYTKALYILICLK